MRIYFCERCGKRVTDMELDADHDAGKNAEGVFCDQCAAGTMATEFKPVGGQGSGSGKAPTARKSESRVVSAVRHRKRPAGNKAATGFDVERGGAAAGDAPHGKRISVSVAAAVVMAVLGAFFWTQRKPATEPVQDSPSARVKAEGGDSSGHRVAAPSPPIPSPVVTKPDSAMEEAHAAPRVPASTPGPLAPWPRSKAEPPPKAVGEDSSPRPIPAGEAKAKGSEWPQLRGGPGYTGVSPDESVKPPLKLLWSYRCDGDTSYDGGAGVAVAGGKVFAFIHYTRSVIALDAERGRFLWEYAQADVHYHDTPSYTEGRVYLRAAKRGESTLVALDAETGKEAWTLKLKSRKNVESDRAGPAVEGGRVYIADSDPDPVILALDAGNGGEVWRASLGKDDGEIVAAPCVAGGRVFTGTHVKIAKDVEVLGKVVALDPKDGRVVWENKAVYPSTGHMVSDGKILVVTSKQLTGAKAAANQKLYVLEAQTGREVWSTPVKGVYHLDALWTDTIMKDFVIERQNGAQMVAHDRDTGNVVWSAPVKTGSGCCSPAFSGKFAYVGTASYNDSEGFWAWRFLEPPHRQKGETGLCWSLHAVDISTGKSVWHHVTGDNVCGDPAIAYGRVYFNSRDGRIYCMAPVKEGESALPDSPDKSPNTPADEVKKLLAEPLPAPRPGKDWPMAGGAPSRAGLAGAALEAPLSPAWRLETGGRVIAAPAVLDGRVFVGSLSGKVFAADLATGEKRWEFETGGEVRCSPAAAGGRVYIGSDDGNFYAFDAGTGKPVWTYKTGGAIQASPLIVGGVVFFGANDQHLYALDRKTGKKLWSRKMEHALVQAPPAFDGERLYAAPWIDWALALDPATGNEIWRTCVPMTIESLQVYRGNLWLRNPYQLAEFDAKTGKRLSIGHIPYGYNAFAFLGDRLLAAGINAVSSVDLNSPGVDSPERDRTPNLKGVRVPAHKWLPDAPRLASMASPLAVGDKIVLATRKGEALLLAPGGKVLWSAALGGPCHAAPVAADGVLLAGCDDGILYAFKEK